MQYFAVHHSYTTQLLVLLMAAITLIALTTPSMNATMKYTKKYYRRASANIALEKFKQALRDFEAVTLFGFKLLYPTYFHMARGLHVVLCVRVSQVSVYR